MSEWLEAARRIVENKSAECFKQGKWTTDITGNEVIILDLYTASMLVQIYDGFQLDHNRETFANLSLERAVEVGWRLVERTKDK